MAVYELIMPPCSFNKALDRAVAEANQAYLDDPEAQARDAHHADVWTRLAEAEHAVRGDAVVLPKALAEDILRMFRGEPRALREEVIINLVDDHLRRAEQRA